MNVLDRVKNELKFVDNRLYQFPDSMPLHEYLSCKTDYQFRELEKQLLNKETSGQITDFLTELLHNDVITMFVPTGYDIIELSPPGYEFSGFDAAPMLLTTKKAGSRLRFSNLPGVIALGGFVGCNYETRNRTLFAPEKVVVMATHPSRIPIERMAHRWGPHMNVASAGGETFTPPSTPSTAVHSKWGLT